MKRFVLIAAFCFGLTACLASPQDKLPPPSIDKEFVEIVKQADAVTIVTADAMQEVQLFSNAEPAEALTDYSIAVPLNDLQHFYRPIEYEFIQDRNIIIKCRDYKDYYITVAAVLKIPLCSRAG